MLNRKTLEMSDDNVLGLEMKLGNEIALECLIKRHQGWIAAQAFKILKDRQDAEEAVFDVFRHLWDNIHKWDPKYGYFKAYLNVVVRNFLIDTYRKKMRRKNQNLLLKDVDLMLKYIEDPDAGPLENLVADETAETIMEAILHALLKINKPRHRLAWMLHEFYGYRYKEVARIMNAKEHTVKVWAFRGRYDIRSTLRHFYEQQIIGDTVCH